MVEHERWMRRSIEIAEHARARGNHPFGALLLGPSSEVLIEAGNAFAIAGDGTTHAERLVATRAGECYGPRFLRDCTLYTSCEPCCMCAGAIYWVGIGRVVFGMSEHSLKDLIGPHPENLTLDLPCRTVFAAGQRPVEVIGPVLPEEAAKTHRGFWT